MVHVFALAGTRSEETRRTRIDDLERHGDRLVLRLRARKLDGPYRIMASRLAEPQVLAAVGGRTAGRLFQHRGG